MEIINATIHHIPSIISIAKVTWNKTYRNIISQAQIDYMLQLFYNEKTLYEQINHPQHHFWVLTHQNELIGYAQCIEDENDCKVLKLSKLYVSPNTQQKGAGKLLMINIERACDTLNKSILTLNVNRQNTAKTFYEKMGFKVVEEIDIPLGNYWLNDYVMQKNLEI